jgi:hypothetical protein
MLHTKVVVKIKTQLMFSDFLNENHIYLKCAEKHGYVQTGHS